MTALHRARAATLTTMPSNKVTNLSTEPLGDDLSSPKRASRATKRTECTSPKTPAGKKNKANNKVSTPPDSPTSDADDDVTFLKAVVNSDSKPSSPTVEIKEEQIEDDQTLGDDMPLPLVKTLAECGTSCKCIHT